MILVNELYDLRDRVIFPNPTYRAFKDTSGTGNENDKTKA